MSVVNRPPEYNLIENWATRQATRGEQFAGNQRPIAVVTYLSPARDLHHCLE